MSQNTRPKGQQKRPQGMPFPMPNAQGQGPAPFPFPMPTPPSPQAAPMSSDQMQQFAEQFATQFATQFAEQFAKQFAEQFAQQLIQQAVSYMPLAPQAPNVAAQQAAQAQATIPLPMFGFFAPPTGNAEQKKGDQSSQSAPAQPMMPFLPFVPFAPQVPQTAGAEANQPAQATFPTPPFPPFQNVVPQPQAMQGLPFAMPFPTPFAPNAQSSEDAQPADNKQTVQTPFGPMPQPLEMYEQMLKGSIDVMGRLLAVSKAVRGATDNEKADEGDESEETNNQGGQSAPFVPPIPGFPQIPVPQPPMQPGSTVGMMPRSDQIGNLLGTLFGASNTEYFYED